MVTSFRAGAIDITKVHEGVAVENEITHICGNQWFASKCNLSLQMNLKFKKKRKEKESKQANKQINTQLLILNIQHKSEY